MELRHPRVSRNLVLVLLWLFFAQVVLAARETSITLDEPLHIASGYACLLTGDYRLVEEHPPALKMLQAAPLLLAQPGLSDPRTVPGWEESDLVAVAQHIVVDYRPIEPLVFAARVPTMLVGVLLGALVYRWTRDLTEGEGRFLGVYQGLPLLSLTLFAFDPNMLAHAGVAATDMGAAAGTFAAMYAFWRWLRRPSGPSWSRVPVAAVMLALALGVKNTALMLGPVFAILILVGRPRGRALRSYLIQGFTLAVGALLVLWSLYRFEIGFVAGLPFPIPAPSHLLPLSRLQQHMRDGHSAFLMGENFHHSDWRYFPVAFLLKTPLAILVLCAWSVVRWATGLRQHRFGTVSRPTALSLLLFPVGYAVASLVSGINIGYRHLLPLLPFLYVVIGRGAAASAGPRAPACRRMSGGVRLRHCAERAVLGGLLVGYIVVTVSLHPWHLAFFNVLAGGPDGGYRYLVDSNLDWGQTWKALRRYLADQGMGEFYMSNYTINDPRAYGLNYSPLPPWPDAPPVLPQRFNPPAGVYAISSTQLQGVVVADPEMFDYFRLIEPTVRVGHAMFVYEIPPRAPVSWVAQCAVPVAPLPADKLREGLGIDTGVPILAFDCDKSWIVPPGNGRYVLSRTQMPSSWPTFSKGRLAYEQKLTGLVPPFSIYEWDSRSGILTAPIEFGDTISVGDSLTLLGYNAQSARAGETALVETWWRIATPPSYPLSLMVHLVGSDGTPIAVGDGLGTAVDQWLTGSLLIQRHSLAIPPDTSPDSYSLHVGAYTFPELTRLPVAVGGSPSGDHVIAGLLEVSSP